MGEKFCRKQPCVMFTILPPSMHNLPTSQISNSLLEKIPGAKSADTVESASSQNLWIAG